MWSPPLSLSTDTCAVLFSPCYVHASLVVGSIGLLRMSGITLGQCLDAEFGAPNWPVLLQCSCRSTVAAFVFYAKNYSKID
jgi:hypothetical protein